MVPSGEPGRSGLRLASGTRVGNCTAPALGATVGRSVAWAAAGAAVAAGVAAAAGAVVGAAAAGALVGFGAAGAAVGADGCAAGAHACSKAIVAPPPITRTNSRRSI